MRTIITIVCLTCALGTSAASAQTMEDAARNAKPDDTLIVTDFAGRTFKGQLVSLSSGSIRLLTPTAVVIPADRVSGIDRLGDPVRDGLRKGAIVGAVFGALNAGATLRRQDRVLFFPKVWTSAIEIGLAGLLFDALHKGRTSLYRAPAKSMSVTVTMTAPAGRGNHGFAVTMRF